MMAATRMPTLAERLAFVRGRVTENAALGPQTWFRVGGPAELLLRPADAEDLAAALAALPPEVPVTVVGAASNLIIRDGGITGVTVKVTRGFGVIARDGNGVIAGAAALDATVAEFAAAEGLAGLEFLCGIPGTIGGAVAMNAGAYGNDIASVLDWVEVVARSGEIVRLPAARLSLAYRHASLPAGGIVVRARLIGQPGDRGVIASRMADIRSKRETTQPVRSRTGGSTFRNPENREGMSAWELIDAAGCRGLRRGAAQVSELHCNFLINTGGATAADLEGLGEEVRRRVHEASGITLEWEIKRIGVHASLARGSEGGAA